MKPNLVIGLGNPLMGDDGIGCRVAELLSADRRLPPDTEILSGGTDLLRHAPRMEGRRRIILVDALLSASDPGTIAVYRNEFGELEGPEQNAHHLSIPGSIALLRAVSPSLAAVRFTLIAVAVASAGIRSELSPALEARLPAILDRVLDELRR